MIEAGGGRPNSTMQSEMVGREFGLVITREVSLGGTSNVWRGLSGPLDPIDYVSRDWIPESGWPIDSRELKYHYTEAVKLLGLPDWAYFSPASVPIDIERLTHDISFDRDLLRNKYFLFTRPPKTFRLDMLQHFDRREDLLLLNAVALEIITHPDGRAVERLVVKGPRGESIDIHAKHFVLAAGALETPRLLLNSRRHNPRGVGNNHDTVGRYLMDHPMGSFSQIRLDRIRRAPVYQAFKLGPGQNIKAGLVLTDDQQRRHHLPNHCFHLWPSFRRGIDDRFEALRRALITAKSKRLSARDTLTLLTNPHALYRILSFGLLSSVRYKYADLFFVTEQMPNRASSVRLSREKDCFGYPIAKIDWIVSDNDLDSIVTCNRLALEALSSPGRQVSFQRNKASISESLTSAAHHLGTARMSENERGGVVDRNLKVWNVHNLYICDASVFPTAGNANPSLTICALALRLADMLATRH